MNSETVIIMPTFNGEKYINEQIMSILNQTYKDFILYIFDDKSTDNTIEVIKKISSLDSRINLIINKEKKGVLKNINDALSTIKANYYFLSDQDDIWLPEKLEKQLKILKKELCIMTFTNLLLVDEKGQSLNTDFWTTQGIDPKLAQKPEYIAIKTMVTGCTMAFNSSLLDFALPISEKATMHDHWLSIIASSIGKIIPIEEQLVHYRQHSKNIIGAYNSRYLTRKNFYIECDSYSKFRSRKIKTFTDLIYMFKAINELLGIFHKSNDTFEQYNFFYESLINRRWFKALWLSFKIKNIPSSNTFFRTLITFYFLPVIYLIHRINNLIK